MPLTELQIKSQKPGEKVIKLFDGGGLFLEVPQKGSKRWRLKYRFGGVEKLISVGLYPEVSLKEARIKRDDAKKHLANGINPSAHRKSVKSSSRPLTTDSFEAVTREWILKESNNWVPSHQATIMDRFERDVFPYIGKMQIGAISSPDLLRVLRRIEERGALESAHRIRGNFGQIFRYATATGRVTSDPSRDLKGALARVKKQHLAAVTDPNEVGELLKMLGGYRGSPIVSTALRLAPLVFVRPGELRTAEWKDIDFEIAQWRFIASKTKTPLIVPLSTQAIELLKEIQFLTNGSRYVFPCARTNDRPMSNNAILGAMRRLAIPKEQMCGHGFRAMARTILDKILKFPPHLIEHQLAHTVKDPLRGAYNRTTHLPERIVMMQRWSDYLDELKKRKFK